MTLIKATVRPLALTIDHITPRSSQVATFRRGSVKSTGWYLYSYQRSGESFALVFTADSREFFEIDAVRHSRVVNFDRFTTSQLRDIYREMQVLANVTFRERPSWWQRLFYDW